MSFIYKGRVIADVGGGGGSEIYSTEETRIGTWIDGRPLYRKVVQFEINALSVWTVASLEIPNVKMRLMEGYVDRAGYSDFSKIAPVGDAKTLSASLLYNTANPEIPKGLVYWVNSTAYYGPAYAVLTYTKTTDEATR